jgi:integrase
MQTASNGTAELTVHEACAFFANFSTENLDDLVASFRKSGQCVPIITYRGAIIDGKNRYRAARKADIAPAMEEFQPMSTDPVGIEVEIWQHAAALNLQRRMLSPKERAAKAIEVQNRIAAISSPSGERIDGEAEPPADTPRKRGGQSTGARERVEEVARLGKTSKRTAERALQEERLVSGAQPQVRALLDGGKVKPAEAAKIAKLAPDVQRFVAGKVGEGVPVAEAIAAGKADEAERKKPPVVDGEGRRVPDVDARIISDNPFKGIKLGKRSNKARQRFIDRTTIDRVLAGCNDPEFKLIIALSRYGALRIPSELDGLLWQHIDRERGRILIHSPKTEHHDAGATREIPLFPELVPFIDEWWNACPEGCEHVIVSNRGTDAAWRTRMYKLLRRLGIPAWPRVWHNLRASRQTELEDRFPSHVVSAWVGTSETVMREHYLMTTADHFAEALKASPVASAQIPAHNGDQCAQNATNAHSDNAKTLEKPRVLRSPAGADGNRTHLAPLQTPHRV